MKFLPILLLITASVNVFAQKSDVIPPDSVFLDRSHILKDAFFVIDDDVSDSIGSVDPNDILSITVVKGKPGAVEYGRNAENGFVVIHTKQYALQKVTDKLGAFSEDFVRFENIFHNYSVSFIINGDERNLETVYNLPLEKITAVKFNNIINFPKVYIDAKP